MKETLKISIIGTGNVATHIASALKENNIEVSHLFGRNKEKLSLLSEKIGATPLYSLDDIPNQLCLVCVSDDAIVEVINAIPSHIPIAYTSGSVKISSMKERKDLGVFYPLQTFTKDKEVNFFEVPLFIESNNDYFTQTLFDLAWTISRSVQYADSEERSKLHLAAVFVNNFTNHIITLSQNYCKEEKVDFDHLRPLLEETISKLKKRDGFDNQTGPAKRNDLKTIDFQKEQLSGNSKEVYEIITKSILKTYFPDDEL